MLELGAGSGLIAVYAVQKEAQVTASDINPVAVDYLHKNSRENKVKMEILCSDLFTAIPPQHFDIIAINPPYYKQYPKTFSEHAWFCGERGEYFSGLFEQLPDYIHATTETIMVLCEGCDIPMIEAAASDAGFRMRLMQAKQHMLEKNFIYKIEKNR